MRPGTSGISQFCFFPPKSLPWHTVMYHHSTHLAVFFSPEYKFHDYLQFLKQCLALYITV